MLLTLTVPAGAQPPAADVMPLRTAPVEKVVANPGFRDWSPITLAGRIILGGNQTGRGGLFAIDAATGKVKWSVRPMFESGTGSISVPPAVAGDLVLAPFPFGEAILAVSLSTGAQRWRGPAPAIDAGIAVGDGLAYVQLADGRFVALETATGKERWVFETGRNRAGCVSRPIVRDGTVYVTLQVAALPGPPARAEGNYLFALDAATGAERWHYRAEAPYVYSGVCLRQPVVADDAIFATGDNYVYAVDRGTGSQRFAPVEVRRMIEGRNRLTEVLGLVDAGDVVVGMTPVALIAFDKRSGRIAWDLPGEYKANDPSTAVARDVLYFQGRPEGAPAGLPMNTLHALDLKTRTILWSYTRPTGEKGWPFGWVTPVAGGLWVDSYQALVKLE